MDYRLLGRSGVKVSEIMLGCQTFGWGADMPTADRTGGGESFASGVLAALLKDQDLDSAVQWGAAYGILVQETPGDISMFDSKAFLAEISRTSSSGGVKATR